MDDNAKTRLDRVFQVAREHPALTAIGAAGIGLFGGLELAAGVLIGAGVAALFYRDPAHGVRERARAVVDAIRGKAAEKTNGVSNEPIDSSRV